MKKRLLLLALSIIVLGIFVAYSNPLALAKTIAGADFSLVAAAFIVSLLCIIVRVLKWHVLIGGSLKTNFIVQNIGIMLSNFTPGKAGEPAKALLLKATNNIDVSRSMPTIIVERLLDLVTVMLFALFAIVFLSIGNYAFIIITGVTIMFVFVFFLLLMISSKRFGSFLFRLLGKIPSLNISKEFIDTFYSTKIQKRRIVFSFIFTIIVWILEGAILYLSMSALHINAPALLALTALISLSIIIAIASFLPGGIGSFEIVLTLFMTTLSINSAASVLLYRFISFWLSMFAGAVCFVYISRRIEIKNILKNIS